MKGDEAREVCPDRRVGMVGTPLSLPTPQGIGRDVYVCIAAIY